MFEKDQEVILADSLVEKLIRAIPSIREALQHSGNVVTMWRMEDNGIIFTAKHKAASFKFFLSSDDVLRYTRQVSPPQREQVAEQTDHRESRDIRECNCPTCLAERSEKERGVEIQKLHSPRELVVVHHCYNVLDRYLGYRTNNALSSLAKYSQNKASQANADPLLDTGHEGYISINLGGEEQKLLDAACRQLRKIIEEGPEAQPQPVLQSGCEPNGFRLVDVDAATKDKLRAALRAAMASGGRD